MIKYLKTCFILPSLFVLSCNEINNEKSDSSKERNKKYNNITTEEAIRLINSNSDIIVIDVRTREEYLEGNIPNTLNIDFMSPDFKNEILKLDKNKEYIVFCKSGNRSTQASDIMSEFGFMKLHNLKNSGYSNLVKAINK